MKYEDLVDRLVEWIEYEHLPDHATDVRIAESVARGLEAALQAAMWCASSHGHAPDRERAIEAFLAAAGANPKNEERE